MHNVQLPHDIIKLSNSFQKYQFNILRYSQTAAVTECSEWTADNTSSSPTCCLYTLTLPKTHTEICMHVNTHSLYQRPGFCQRMCQRYQSYFSPGQFSRSQIRAKVVVHTSLHNKSAHDLSYCPCVLPLFLFSDQIVCLYVWSFCVHCFIK